MIAKLLLQNTAFVIGMGALLFASAGTLQWPGAWAYLIGSAVLGPAGGVWLARVDPGLLAERMRLTAREEQPAADKYFMLVLIILVVIWLVAMGLDRRFDGANAGTALMLLGLVLYLISMVLILWVFRTNSFAAPVVKVQAERDHRVISTGPYALVRHPMYASIMLFFIGVPLMLGSWWGLAFVPVFFLMFAIRTRIEERTLAAGLPGYADYATRVRYRLVPGLW
ncbi:isoprenylcysteine carboxylmethyltransferase family protein [Bradyrhizobium sp. ISRA443]|uniref:methyltransferase family protein n=1 Tax=unclassified Bradyrhizobium TaxID=2631580 RepID=UPI002478AAE8|nr:MULTISPECIES: isoprenylcysteine carboxylmethyltransferase family protein [unclassified Bradyrhizobium]WGR91392.1 isoprenylcysteine carboxylmethyltransferase family protein [Bradyrhizobium sp. ISRA435]WGS01637.1 isoprenylcysteine carboxylmethyltransferase family protein [Bradyrhizobium sp. ISRA436]WGS08523.1 isoprenylcysteine carboxylmethyltransferase family protein [Bradyrhizobium sp. ISRA437]WGS15411.1 isoprenylcysteine carboxylmethyltransferase family protein [Bradyrhizobium sp. ISRA443]